MRKKIATISCLLAGPIFLYMGMMAVKKDMAYAKNSVPVQADITSSQPLHSSKGKNRLIYDVDFTAPETPTLKRHGSFTVYQDKAAEVAATLPLQLQYTSSYPTELRYPGTPPQGWIILAIGAIFCVGAIYGFRTWEST